MIHPVKGVYRRVTPEGYVECLDSSEGGGKPNQCGFGVVTTDWPKGATTY